MSYTIFYDRRFIKIPGHGYIPMVQMGNSNVFEISPYSGKEIPEKTWFVLNTLGTNQVIFSENEIMQMAADLEKDAEYGNIAKTRYTFFKPGEITRWFRSGIKNAKTLEDYVSWGNKLEVEVRTDKDYQLFYPTTTEELLNEILLYQIAGKRINLYFNERNFKTPRLFRKRKEKTLQEYPFIIETEIGYLHHMSKYKIYATYIAEQAKKFRTEKEAQKYIEKYGMSGKWKVIYKGPKNTTKQLSILETHFNT
ncbi:hypothetical protein [Thermoanaerobacter mathranii]|uniref:hypothetical protein n=1 Tax=Thermoanaerobacter mathranii TaxID=583357 RepID=UPI003D6AA18D